MNFLFIGTFLSNYVGTKSISEKISENFKESYSIKLVSYKRNRILRIIDILISVLFFKGKRVFIDVFSDNSFHITSIASFILNIRKKEIILILRGGKLVEYYNKNKNYFSKSLNRATSINTPSNYLKNYFSEFGYKINYLPNFIDTSIFTLKNKNCTNHSLLWVRSFSEIYNPKLAVKIVYKLKKRYPDVRLTMIGPDQGILNDIKKLIKELKLTENIIIEGPIENKKLPAYYHSNRIYLNTTTYESFGTAVYEAASCGIPIVSTNVGEIQYGWDNEHDMLIVDDFNEDSFIIEIEKIFNNIKLENKIISNARNKAEILSWKNIKPLWHELLNVDEIIK